MNGQGVKPARQTFSPARGELEGGAPGQPIFLQAGDFHFGTAPLQIATLLGSCVTVTLWQPRRRIGGMCHFLVPARPGNRRPQGVALDGHFAEEAFALFDQALLKHDCRPEQFQAKLFGGGDMFPGSNTRVDVGGQNIAAARALLKRRGIPLLAEHVGGAGHRKLIFDLATGEVQLRFVDKSREGLVTPAKAGVQCNAALDTGLRRCDEGK